MAYPTVSVTGDPVPSDWEVHIGVEVSEPFTESSPAELRIEFGNEAPTEREFDFDTVAPFGPVVGRSDAGGRLHAIPNDDGAGAGPYPAVVPRSPIDGCWKLADPYPTGYFGLLWPAGPGATMAMTYAVLDDPEADDCLPVGEYRFEDEWGERLPNDEIVEHSWGFTAELKR